jgi:hypothetical protein
LLLADAVVEDDVVVAMVVPIVEDVTVLWEKLLELNKEADPVADDGLEADDADEPVEPVSVELDAPLVELPVVLIRVGPTSLVFAVVVVLGTVVLNSVVLETDELETDELELLVLELLVLELLVLELLVLELLVLELLVLELVVLELVVLALTELESVVPVEVDPAPSELVVVVALETDDEELAELDVVLCRIGLTSLEFKVVVVLKVVLAKGASVENAELDESVVATVVVVVVSLLMMLAEVVVSEEEVEAEDEAEVAAEVEAAREEDEVVSVSVLVRLHSP